MGLLAGQVCIVTGAGQGLGRAVALEMVAEGAKVMLLERNPATLRTVEDEVAAAGGIARPFQLDVTDYETYRAAVGSIIGYFVGRLAPDDVNPRVWNPGMGALIGAGAFALVGLAIGAIEGGMDTLATQYDMTSLNLSVSFRCPRAIVEAARWRVPGFQWIKDGGHVEILDKLDPTSVDDGATVLCRNNAPLFAMAMGMLGAGHGVNVAGMDVGARLIAVMRKLGDEDMTRAQAEIAIDQWLAEKLARESNRCAP